jgi:hypothetical protein
MALAKSKSDVTKQSGFIGTIKTLSKKFTIHNKHWEDEGLAIGRGWRTTIRRMIVVYTGTTGGLLFTQPDDRRPVVHTAGTEIVAYFIPQPADGRTAAIRPDVQRLIQSLFLHFRRQRTRWEISWQRSRLNEALMAAIKSPHLLLGCNQNLPSSQRQNEVLTFAFICTISSLIKMSASDYFTTFRQSAVDVYRIAISTLRHVPRVLVMQIVISIAF